MIKIVVLIALLLNGSIAFSQTYYPYQDIKLETPADCKAANPIALHAATTLLSTPFKKADKDRASALQFIVKWMTAGKEFKFIISEKMQGIVADADLFGLYTAAMAKFCLENKNLAGVIQVVENSSCKLVLDYCEIDSNNFPLKKKQRKILENN